LREKNLKDCIESVEKEKVDQERINKAKENEIQRQHLSWRGYIASNFSK
jgi:hypothetical protein